MTGLSRGYSHFKFFPAEAAGGIKMLKAIAGPFPKVTFCPTGGISPDNYRDYLALANVACVGGSWIVPGEALEQGDWGRITGLAGEAVNNVGL
jgi:2-dehydro-3-deoxyphosphogluconate aldolase/(4S)-4-hydroxy-2-oxoglutarate aldolase